MRKFKIISAFVLVCVLIWSGFQLKDQSFAVDIRQMLVSNEKGSNVEEWNLILVNSQNKVPNNYTVELIQLSNGEQVDARIYPSLQKMFDDARAQGVYPVVISGYRTNEKQEQLMKEKIVAYEAEGNSNSEATKLAENWVAVPGTSEHQLGIAVDINAEKGTSTNEEVYEWLNQNAHKYGFILRYPPDKIEATGVMYEPWHYRYVGNDVALQMYEQGVCLEEFLVN